jgi:hypothetical protein
MSLVGTLIGSLLLACAGAAAFWWASVKAPANKFDLKAKRSLMSAAERNFFEGLMKSLGGDFYVFAKIRVSDVLQPSVDTGWFQEQQVKLRLADETFDYLLCKKQDMSVFGVVELETFEKGTDRKMRAAREKLIGEVCKRANLRVFYFDIRQDYRSMDIRRLVTGKSAKKKSPANGASAIKKIDMTMDSASVSHFSDLRACPKCHSELVSKVAVKGKRIGEKFLMCRKYPYCDYQVSMTDAKFLKMQKQEQKKVKKAGFSDWAG